MTVPHPMPSATMPDLVPQVVLAVYAAEDAGMVEPALEAIRSRGFEVHPLPITESDRETDGASPPPSYLATVVFLSARLIRSRFDWQVLEVLARGGGQPWGPRPMVSIRLDDTPIPSVFDDPPLADLRDAPVEWVADRVKGAVGAWGAVQVVWNRPGGDWYRAVFALGLPTDLRTQEGLRLLVGDLDEPARDLFRMRFLDRLDDEQIANRLDIPREAVPLRVDKLLKQIRSRFPRVY